MAGRTKVAIVAVVVVALIAAAATWVIASDIGENGKITDWDGSGGSTVTETIDPQPMLMATAEVVRPPESVVKKWTGDGGSKIVKKITSAELLAAGVTGELAQNLIYCVNSWSNTRGGNSFDRHIVWATLKASWCFQHRTNTADRILTPEDVRNLEERGIYGTHPYSFSRFCDADAIWLWSCDNQGDIVSANDGTSCENGNCWEYVYRRAAFAWTQVVPNVGPFHASSWASMTIRGTGATITDRKES